MQFGLQPSQRVIAEDHIDWPVGADQQKTRRVTAPRQVRHEVQGRLIAPVQVLENDNQQAIGGDRFDRLGQVTQRSFARAASKLALQRLAIGGRQ